MTPQMLLFFALLTVTVVLFVSDRLRVDLIALIIMVTLSWLGLVTPKEAIGGLASNAVVSIIGVIILGYGIDRTGIMARVAAPAVNLAGKSERRLQALISLVVGIISAFMQNIGAAALFLPAVQRMAKRMNIPTSRVLMPLGFSAILGGTLTMVASGPLILLNDLLRQNKQAPYDLFAVGPIGLALLLAGIIYFAIAGRLVLPRRQAIQDTKDPQRVLMETWGLPASILCAKIPPRTAIIGKTLDEIALWSTYQTNLLIRADQDELQYAPWRHTRFSAGQQLALLGEKSDVERLAADYGLELIAPEGILKAQLEKSDESGFAEVIIRPHASIAGKSLRQIALRKTCGVEPVLRLSGDQPVERDFSDTPLKVGDTLVVHGLWSRIAQLQHDSNFVLIAPVNQNAPLTHKALLASTIFLASIGLAVAGFPLSISLLSGAIAMVLTKVITMDEAYGAVDWRTVFLLAGLIPLGTAMQNTGAAAWIASHVATLLAGRSTIILLSVVGLLATLFSLFMSNVAATVLLVPMVAQLAAGAGISPRPLGLLVAVCASNSFILPTHQVNALLMGPGGYRNADYLKAGSIMSLLFLAISVGLIGAFYL